VWQGRPGVVPASPGSAFSSRQPSARELGIPDEVSDEVRRVVLSIIGAFMIVAAVAHGLQPAASKLSVAAPIITAKSANPASSASFGFTGSSRVTVGCAVDGSAFAPCASPKSYSGLARGVHTFQVKAVVGTHESGVTN
jgi:hypothetical protein